MSLNKEKRVHRLMRRLASSFLMLSLLAGAMGFPPGAKAAEATTHCESNIGSPADLKVSERGLMPGYLEPASLPDSLTLAAPPPTEGSAEFAVDKAVSEATFPRRNTSRWALAARDADLHFPAAASVFSCVMGVEISKAETPRLYTLLQRTLTDAGLSTYRAKNHYQRPRPFMGNGQPICTPDDEEGLTTDGSYPSGHTAVGWAWALILSEIVPTQKEQILQRGLEYGKSRNICNVHWHSDVQAGRLLGTATVAQLHADPVFRADLRAAAAEVASQQQRHAGPDSGYCALERSALKP